MQKIWYAMWEVMYACVKNAAPETVVLSLVERFVNRSYNDAVENLKETNAIDSLTEIKAKEQSNIEKMAHEFKVEQNVNRHIKLLIYRVVAAIVIAGIVSFFILKFKTTGLVIILTMLIVYHLIPVRRN
jgi:magnesium-transporting ATPase (P-type)